MRGAGCVCSDAVREGRFMQYIRPLNPPSLEQGRIIPTSSKDEVEDQVKADPRTERLARLC